MMTTIPTHENPFIWTCVDHCAQVSSHMSRRVDEKECLVAEEIVCFVERSKFLPRVGLEAEFVVVSMVDHRALKRRVRIDWEARGAGCATSGAGYNLSLGEFGTVANVIEVEMAEYHNIDR